MGDNRRNRLDVSFWPDDDLIGWTGWTMEEPGVWEMTSAGVGTSYWALSEIVRWLVLDGEGTTGDGDTPLSEPSAL